MLERRTFRLSRQEVREQIVMLIESTPNVGARVSKGEACLAFCGGMFGYDGPQVMLEWPTGKQVVKAEDVAKRVLGIGGFVVSARWLNSPPEMYQPPELEIVADIYTHATVFETLAGEGMYSQPE